MVRICTSILNLTTSDAQGILQASLNSRKEKECFECILPSNTILCLDKQNLEEIEFRFDFI